MKAKLEFDLPDDKEDYTDCINGSKYKILIWDLLNTHIRQKTKYESDALSEDYLKALEETRDFIWKRLEEDNIAEGF